MGMMDDDERLALMGVSARDLREVACPFVASACFFGGGDGK